MACFRDGETFSGQEHGGEDGKKWGRGELEGWARLRPMLLMFARGMTWSKDPLLRRVRPLWKGWFGPERD